MDKFFEDVSKNTALVIATAMTTALGTMLLKTFFGGGSVTRRKHPKGSGPTGKGKWKLYHTNTFRSARCLWLIEGKILKVDILVKLNLNRLHRNVPLFKEKYKVSIVS